MIVANVSLLRPCFYMFQRWQRRFMVLYDDGELTYSVDDNVSVNNVYSNPFRNGGDGIALPTVHLLLEIQTPLQSSPSFPNFSNYCFDQNLHSLSCRAHIFCFQKIFSTGLLIRLHYYYNWKNECVTSLTMLNVHVTCILTVLHSDMARRYTCMYVYT